MNCKTNSSKNFFATLSGCFFFRKVVRRVCVVKSHLVQGVTGAEGDGAEAEDAPDAQAPLDVWVAVGLSDQLTVDLVA